MNKLQNETDQNNDAEKKYIFKLKYKYYFKDLNTENNTYLKVFVIRNFMKISKDTHSRKNSGLKNATLSSVKQLSP